MTNEHTEAPPENTESPQPDAAELKRSLRAVAQERNEARARLRELETQLEEQRERSAGAPDPERIQSDLDSALERLEDLEAELRRYRVEMPLIEAFAAQHCAAPADALKLVREHVRQDGDGRVQFLDLDDPERVLTREDGTGFDFADFAGHVLQRKPHLSLRPPAVGSGTPAGAAETPGSGRPDSRRDPEGYRQYFIRKYGRDPRSLVSL